MIVGFIRRTHGLITSRRRSAGQFYCRPYGKRVISAALLARLRLIRRSFLRSSACRNNAGNVAPEKGDVTILADRADCCFQDVRSAETAQPFPNIRVSGVPRYLTTDSCTALARVGAICQSSSRNTVPVPGSSTRFQRRSFDKTPT